jgi:hypothetical protein
MICRREEEQESRERGKRLFVHAGVGHFKERTRENKAKANDAF